jgi:hypothetical protein
VYAQLKFLWANGERTLSIERLRNFVDELSRDLDGRHERHPSKALSTTKVDELSRLLAKCYLKLGEWKYEIEQNWKSVVSLSTSSTYPRFSFIRRKLEPTFWTGITMRPDTIRAHTKRGIRGH